MKLYYLAGACSLASHISLLEAGVAHTAIAVDRQTRLATDGQDFRKINPKGYVPALLLDSGELLTESAVLLPYIGNLNPAAKLIPAPGSIGAYRVAEWCAYISTEVHKTLGPIFRPGTTDEQNRQRLHRRGCLPVRDPQLEPADRRRSGGAAAAGGPSRASAAAPLGTGRPQGRGAAGLIAAGGRGRSRNRPPGAWP